VAKIELAYRRAFEPDKPPAKAFNLTVRAE
jgi:predicted secreted protein